MTKRIGVFFILLVSTVFVAFSPADEQYFRYPGLLVNPGFENRTSRWTNSGSGTLAVEAASANVAFGINSGAWDAAANNDTLTSSQMTIPIGWYGQICKAEFLQKGGDSNLSARVIDGSLATVANVALATAANFTRVNLFFVCPSSGTLAFRLIASANAAIVYIDQVHIGLVSSESGFMNFTSINGAPILGGSSADPTGVTYGNQTGRFSRVGNVVFVDIRLEFTTYTGGTGNIQIKNLPYTVASGTNTLNAAISTSNVDFSAGYTYPAVQFENGATHINVVQGGDNIALTSLTLAAVPSSGTTKSLYVTGFYFTN